MWVKSQTFHQEQSHCCLVYMQTSQNCHRLARRKVTQSLLGVLISLLKYEMERALVVVVLLGGYQSYVPIFVMVPHVVPCLTIHSRLRRMELSLEKQTMSTSNVLFGMTHSASCLHQSISAPRLDIPLNVLMELPVTSIQLSSYFQQTMKNSKIITHLATQSNTTLDLLWLLSGVQPVISPALNALCQNWRHTRVGSMLLGQLKA